MQRYSRSLPGLAACIALAAAGSSTAVATQTVHLRKAAAPHLVKQTAPAAKEHRLGAHHIFGTIMAIDGNMLSVLRRNNKYVAVDATTALANNDYSYPLFVGKDVAIDGSFTSTAQTVFTAIHINAIPTLQSLESDD